MNVSIALGPQYEIPRRIVKGQIVSASPIPGFVIVETDKGEMLHVSKCQLSVSTAPAPTTPPSRMSTEQLGPA